MQVWVSLRSKEIRNFGGGLYLFCALDWEIEVFQVGLLPEVISYYNLLHSRSCWEEVNLLEADLVWREGMVLV